MKKVATLLLILLSFQAFSNSGFKMLCFYLNKEKTKRLCLGGEEEIQKLGNRVSVNGHLYIEGKEDKGPGRIMKNNIIFDEDLCIQPYTSGLNFKIYIPAGSYTIDDTGTAIVPVRSF